MSEASTGPVRLSELVACLSLVTDLGMGQPLEQALTTCRLSFCAGRELGLDDNALSDLYYLALLRFIGCTADASEFAAAVGGDDVATRAGIAPVLNGENVEFLRHVLGSFGRGTPPLTRLKVIAAALAEGASDAARSIADHCQVAQLVAPRIGFSHAVAVNVGLTFERWDGKGMPGTHSGEEIPLACRIVMVARDAEILSRLGGWSLAADCMRRRRGKAYDPAVADLFLDQGEHWLQGVAEGQTWEAVVAAEPGRPITMTEDRLDEALTAFADLADLKAPSAAGHSRAVAESAEAAARSAGLGEDEVTAVRRAALVHDLGKAGVPSGILDKPGPLSQTEWERVRLHPYYTERVLAFVPGLAAVATLAGAHHERVDGSGYHRGSPGAALSPASRILAAANAYQALSQDRPYRSALDGRERERELREQVSQGKLDHEAVRHVLDASGRVSRYARPALPAGLTDREVEVLRLVARGHSNRSVAQRLTVSPKTVSRHLENVYAKIGVASRATAALFAMEHRLLDD